ncbi:MAG TPA: hypothetical protein VH062_16595 [Polyangiaceae bacterium]|nr:hypothetical protein [Polyangiaceae bacterium]
MLKDRLSQLKSRVKETLEKAQSEALVKVGPRIPAVPGEEPPVVARLMVEIRSDGSQTIARGALEEMTTGEKVAVEARGTTPAQLAASLAKTIFASPLLAKVAVRAILDGRPGARKANGNGEE